MSCTSRHRSWWATACLPPHVDTRRFTPSKRDPQLRVRLAPGDGDEVLITFADPPPPGAGGYRPVDPWRVGRLLDRLRPDAIEVSDRLTLRGLGAWARRAGVPSVVISHGRLDRLPTQFLLPAPTAAGSRGRARWMPCSPPWPADPLRLSPDAD